MSETRTRASGLARDIAQADRDAVRTGMRRCAERFSERTWLDPSSGFLTRPGEYLGSLNARELGAASHEIAEFAAASSVLHCFDSWTTLGNAIHAVAVGNLSQGIHLAYYAELRAALSMMGSTGVVVQKDTAVAVASDSTRQLRAGSSHEILWDIFSAWCASETAQDLVSACLRFHRVPMATWISTARKGGSGLPVVSELLNQWGVDLAHFKGDRTSRNLASYNPTFLHEVRRPGTANWCQNAVTGLVSMLEPRADSSFSDFDNRLFPSIARNIGIADENNLRRVTRTLAGSAYEGEELLKRISQVADLSPTVLNAAGRDPAGAETTASVVESMLGRALILCRLATGGAVRLRIEAGLATEDLRWWSDEISMGYGYWDPAHPPDKLRDLWVEMDEGLQEVMSVDLNRSESPYEMLVLASDGLRTISSLGRVAIWSISA